MSEPLANFLTALAAGIPTLLAVILSNRSHDKVIDEKLKHTDEKIDERSKITDQKITDLAIKVEKHNNLIERMVVVEQSTKSAHHRIDDVVNQLKITEKRQR